MIESYVLQGYKAAFILENQLKLNIKNHMKLSTITLTKYRSKITELFKNIK